MTWTRLLSAPAILLMPLAAAAQNPAAPHFGSGTRIDGGVFSSGTSSNENLSNPAITGGSLKSSDLSDAVIKQPGAVASAATGAAFQRLGLYPDDFKQTADGNDDAPSIQRAMNAVCSQPGLPGSWGVIRLHWRGYEIDSPVSVPCAVRMEGGGWEEQVTLGGGSWLHITSALGTTNSAFNLTTTFARASIFENFAVTEDQPTPSTTANTAWTPTAYAPVFNLSGVDAALFFKHILWDGVTRGIYANGAGRVELDGMYADVFTDLIVLDGSQDVDRIRNIHVWPYWTNATAPGSATTPAMTAAQQGNVEAYRIVNTNPIILNRADTPFLDELFGIGLHSLVQIGYTATGITGTTTKAHIGRMSCDSNQYCLWVRAAVTSQASAIIDQMDYQGQDPVLNNGTPRAGGNMIDLDGNALLQIQQMHAEIVYGSIFNMPTTTSCSEVHVGSLWVNWAASPPTAAMATMPKCSNTGFDLLYLMDYAGNMANSGGGATTAVNGVGHLLMPALTERNSNAQ